MRTMLVTVISPSVAARKAANQADTVQQALVSASGAPAARRQALSDRRTAGRGGGFRARSSAGTFPTSGESDDGDRMFDHGPAPGRRRVASAASVSASMARQCARQAAAVVPSSLAAAPSRIDCRALRSRSPPGAGHLPGVPWLAPATGGKEQAEHLFGLHQVAHDIAARKRRGVGAPVEVLRRDRLHECSCALARAAPSIDQGLVVSITTAFRSTTRPRSARRSWRGGGPCR